MKNESIYINTFNMLNSHSIPEKLRLIYLVNNPIEIKVFLKEVLMMAIYLKDS